MKLLCLLTGLVEPRRPPSRGRGLKYHAVSEAARSYLSPPLAGAWIEICLAECWWAIRPSPPLAGAWIEIGMPPMTPGPGLVAPPRGGVD